MARKKKSSEAAPDMPASAAADKRTGSRHKPRKMMPLPPWLYTALKASARKNSRPATWHLRHIVIRSLLEDGTLSEDDVRKRTGDEFD